MAIVPKNMAPGIDLCGTSYSKGYTYIVRSDLDCLMRVDTINSMTEKQDIYPLHPICRNGEAYLANGSGYFYIIRGNQYRRNTSLQTDSGGQVWDLHPNCRNGDFYLGGAGDGSSNYKYIIKGNRYRRVEDMTTDSKSSEWDIHPSCRGGLYYWGRESYKYFLKEDQWGVAYHRVKDLTNNTDHQSWAVAPSVLGFLPGGMAVQEGDSRGRWAFVRSVTNDSTTTPIYKITVETVKGYRSSVTQSVESNWKVHMSTSVEVGIKVNKAQFAFSQEYGGSRVDTYQEDWSEERRVIEEMHVQLEPGQTVYFWQYVMSYATNQVLMTGHYHLTKDYVPPTTSPLPPSGPSTLLVSPGAPPWGEAQQTAEAQDVGGAGDESAR